MRKIIIGSTGFIGSKFTNFLIKQGDKPITCSRKNSDIHFDLNKNNFDEIEDFLADGDFIYFFAGISSPDYCEKNPIHSRKINLLGTVKLIEKILEKNCKVLFTSTDAVYSDSSERVDEDTLHAPIGKYGLYKSEVENTFNKQKNFKVARFSYVIGSDSFSNYLAEDRSLEKNIFKGFKRRVVSINDVLLGLYNFKDSFKSVNFCGPDFLSRIEIAKLYKKHLFHDLILNEVEAPEGFWNARARCINMDSKYFEKLISKKPVRIQDQIGK